jgi:hypothetical protein
MLAEFRESVLGLNAAGGTPAGQPPGRRRYARRRRSAALRKRRLAMGCNPRPTCNAAASRANVRRSLDVAESLLSSRALRGFYL